MKVITTRSWKKRKQLIVFLRASQPWVSHCSFLLQRRHTAPRQNIWNQGTCDDIVFTSPALVFLSFWVPPIPLILLVHPPLPPPPPLPLLLSFSLRFYPTSTWGLLSFFVSGLPQPPCFFWFPPPPPSLGVFSRSAVVNSKQLSGRSFETKRGLFHSWCIVTVGLQLPSLATNSVHITRKQMTYGK